MQNSVPLESENSIDADDPTSAIDQPDTGIAVLETVSVAPSNKMALQRLDSIKPGTVVLIESRDGSGSERYFVRHSSRSGATHTIRLVRSPLTEREVEPEVEEPDYYDVLQIGAKAEAETIYRVYRIMAARFHPDNPKTGDVEKFLLLNAAYEVLSDPERRSEYDARRQKQEAEPLPVFELKDFVTGVEAEANRRLGVLSLLYNQRRQDPEHPVGFAAPSGTADGVPARIPELHDVVSAREGFGDGGRQPGLHDYSPGRGIRRSECRQERDSWPTALSRPCIARPLDAQYSRWELR